MHEAIYEKLKEVARARKLITYGEMNEEFNPGLDFDRPEDRGKVGELFPRGNIEFFCHFTGKTIDIAGLNGLSFIYLS